MPRWRNWWNRPTSPLFLIAAAQLTIHLATNGAYGFHTDELYYIASGQHPAFGYVDFPPVTPLLASLDTAIFGVSPWALRLFPALTSAGMVLLTGLCARELGASRGIASLASAVALLSLYLLATWLFQTVEFDELTWLLAIYLVLRIIRTGDSRLFVLVGLDLGVGIETKFTILGLWVGIAIAMLTSHELRRLLRTPYPWIGLTIAVAAAAPNAAWQLANGFPSLSYVANHRTDISQGGGIAAFAGLFVLLVGPLFVPLFVAGFVLLIREPRFRAMGLLAAAVILLFLPDGKAYYPAPVVPFVLAAGCVAVGRIMSPGRRRWVAGLLIAGGIVEAGVVLPIILPVVPPPAMHGLRIDRMNPDFANTVGWPEMTAQVGAVYNSLPPEQRSHTAILTAIDGQAGAIDIYGGSEHLPQAISPHLSFWYWKPAGLEPTTLVTVGYAPSDVAFLCGSVTRAGTVVVPYSIDNLNQGSPILVCTELRESLDAAWPALRNFS